MTEIAYARPDTPRGEIDRLIEKYAALYEVPEDLVRRVVKRESNFNPERLQSRPLGPDADQARDGARHGL